MVTIIIPVYNEETSLPLVLEEITNYFRTAQIIVINNNSTDKSQDIISDFQLKFNNIEQYFCEQKGKSNAIRSIFSKIKYDVVVIQDADLEYKVYDVQRLVKNHLCSEADMTIGVRKNKLIRSTIANSIIKMILFMRFRVTVHDILTGARVVNKSLLIQCQANGFGLETELTKLGLQQQLKIVQDTCGYQPRIVGKKIRAVDLLYLIKVAIC